MRPLYHPKMDEVTVEGILHALSDPIRIQIVIKLLDAACAQNCSTFLNIKETPLPKSTLSQHFRILRETGIIRSERKGVELSNTLRCEEMDEKFPGLIHTILRAYATQHEKKKKG
jgi:DNA-binding transcriptional ArsR family regulator